MVVQIPAVAESLAPNLVETFLPLVYMSSLVQGGIDGDVAI